MSSLDELRLVCPRCRSVTPSGELRTSHLNCSSSGKLARPGKLETEAAIVCGNAACNARFPVVSGVPLIFRHADTIGWLSCAPLDLTGQPAEALVAYLNDSDPSSELSQLAGRLARGVWASFHDWLHSPEAPLAGATTPHAVRLIRWLGSRRPRHRQQQLRPIRIGREMLRRVHP